MVEDNIRISRFLASCGISSRRKCEQLVIDGRVKVNNEVVKDLSKKIFSNDMVQLDGKKMMFEEKDARGNRRYATDREFRKKVDSMAEKVWGSGDNSIIVGG